jgi:hypothetical protein
VIEHCSKFECFLIDGPAGSFRRSRFGALEVIRDRMEEEFIVIFDDAQRIGEVDTIRECRNLLKRMQVTFAEKTFYAASTQHVFYTGKFRKIATF